MRCYHVPQLIDGIVFAPVIATTDIIPVRVDFLAVSQPVINEVIPGQIRYNISRMLQCMLHHAVHRVNITKISMPKVSSGIVD